MDVDGLLFLTIDFGFTFLLRQNSTILCFMVALLVIIAPLKLSLLVLLLELRLVFELALIRKCIYRS